MTCFRALCAFFLVPAFCVYGQAVNATLLGAVTDASGAVIPNAKVITAEVDTGISHVSRTNESGNYTFPDLPPGRYAVSVEAAGFKRESRNGIDVVVDSSVRVDVQLQPGSISESIEVTGAPPPLETDRADTGRKIETLQTEAMPLGANRNFQGLLNLVPGTTRAAFDHSQFFNAASSLQTEVNGQLRQGNNYQIEGIDDNDATGNLQLLIPPIEAIQTVDMSTSNFEAELGRASGAVTNVILKSGTNSLHGAGYEFLQNTDLDARSFFNPSVGQVHYNYFGGNVGGPIRKNKVFFFGDYLRVEDHEANANLGTIPSIAFRNGDLSASPTVVYNPFSGNADGTNRTPLPNNQVPLSLINPISAKILALLPATNQSFNPASPSNNYFALLPFSKDSDSFDAKIDDNVTDEDRLSGRFSFARPVIFQAPIFGNAGGWAPAGNSGFQGTGTQKVFSSGINYDKIFSPSLISEFRLGVAYLLNVARNSDYGTADSTNLGIPGVNIDPFSSGTTTVKIGGGFSSPLIGYNVSMPWVKAETSINLVNTWTRILGNHTIKWGADLRRIRFNSLQEANFSSRGTFTFAEAQTSIPGAKTGFGNDFASFLFDQPSQVGRDLTNYFPGYRAWQFFTFVQDKWIVTPKLTLDLGVRWEFYPPLTPQFPGTFSNYNPVNQTLVIAGIGGNPGDLGMATKYNYFAPRFGAAYRVTNSTVVRAGFGMSYTPFPGPTYAWNFPVTQSNSFQPAGTGFGPALLANGQPATFQAGLPLPIPFAPPANGIITNPSDQAYYVIPLNFRNPYVESWNLAVQRALPAHFTLDVAYVGNHGVRASFAEPNINAATVVGLGTKGQPEYPRTSAITMLYQGFSTMYNALQVKLDHRFAAGLLVTTAFTWGKGMDYQLDDFGGLLYYINPQRNYARTDFDRTLTFVQSYVYQLPFGRGQHWLRTGPASAALGGWQLSGILTVMSGLPVNFSYSASGLSAPGNSQSPNQIAPIQLLHGINVGNPWFSLASFAAPPLLTFGNIGRNSISGPAFFDLDLSLFKNIRMTERLNLELRCETFAFTNTPQFSNPGATLGSSSFGYVTGVVASGSGVNGVGGGRAVQFGAKLTF